MIRLPCLAVFASLLLVACSDSESPSSGLGSTLSSQSGGGAGASGFSGSSGGSGAAGSGGDAGAVSCSEGCKVYNGTHAIDFTVDPPCKRLIRTEPELIYCFENGCHGLGITSYRGSEHDGLLEYTWAFDYGNGDDAQPPGWRSASEDENDLIKNAPLCGDHAGN